MKRILSSLVAFSLAAVLLASCGDTNSNIADGGNPIGDASEAYNSDIVYNPGDAMVSTMAATVSVSSGINSSLVLSREDITASGDISDSSILYFYGVQSMTYQQDGGTLYVVQATPGEADTVAAGFTAMNDALLAQGENYKAEFPEAYAHLENAVIKTEGDYVIYAVSANGEYEALATSVDQALELSATAA